MTYWRARFALICCCLVALAARSANCRAAAQDQGKSPTNSPESATSLTEGQQAFDKDAQSATASGETSQGGDNTLGVNYLKNLAKDQEIIWTSPSHLKWGDATWL